MRKIVLSVILITILALSYCSNYFLTKNPTSPSEIANFDTGDIAWMLVSSALVLLMTPGLGFFYGGMVGKKNVISTMLQSFMAMIIVTVLWVLVAFGLSFGPSIGGIIGNPIPHLFFQGVGIGTSWKLAPTIPFLLFAIKSSRLDHFSTTVTTFLFMTCGGISV